MSEDEQLYGLPGIEHDQGFEPMPVAHPAPSTDDLPTDLTMTESDLAHLKRPEPEPPIDRSYRDGAGNEIDDKYSVTAQQAFSDLQRTRDAERQAREDAAAQDLRSALDQTEQPQQPAQQPDQQPVDGVQPEYQVDPAEAAARSEVDAAWQAADQKITEMLQDPVIRERIQGEYDQIKQTAAAEAKAEVERAYVMSGAVRDHYQQATTNLLNEAGGIIGALVPELNGLSGPQLQGALQVMAQTNPQRLQALQHLASRAQGLVEAQARQQYEAQQGAALQRDAALERYTSANVQEYENWSARENPETMKSIRENIKPTVEKYGVPFQALMDIHTGKTQMGATEFVRSAAFQKMLHDSIKYNLATRGVTEARSNPIPRVQRPGANVEPRGDEGSYATLERSLRGQSLNPKQAADLLIAHRARSR